VKFESIILAAAYLLRQICIEYSINTVYLIITR